MPSRSNGTAIAETGLLPAADQIELLEWVRQISERQVKALPAKLDVR